MKSSFELTADRTLWNASGWIPSQYLPKSSWFLWLSPCPLARVSLLYILPHWQVRSWYHESQQIYTPRGWDTPLPDIKGALSCARGAQPALPAPQEAREDAGPFGGCSVPAPLVWAQPRVPLLAVGAHEVELSQGTAGTRESRMKAGGRVNGCCRTSHTAHFCTGSLLPSGTPQALPTRSCWLLSSAQWSFPHPWGTHQDNTAPWPLSLTPLGQSLPKIKDIRCNSQKTTRRKAPSGLKHLQHSSLR